jgi:Uma2 family endonuclease
MVTVEEIYLPLTLSAPGLTDAQFQDFCEQYADFRLEYTAEGELVIKPLV